MRTNAIPTWETIFAHKKYTPIDRELKERIIARMEMRLGSAVIINSRHTLVPIIPIAPLTNPFGELFNRIDKMSFELNPKETI